MIFKPAPCPGQKDFLLEDFELFRITVICEVVVGGPLWACPIAYLLTYGGFVLKGIKGGGVVPTPPCTYTLYS